MRPSNCWDGGTSSLDSLFAWPLVGPPYVKIRRGVQISPRAGVFAAGFGLGM
jgi:hypothetical protein